MDSATTKRWLGRLDHERGNLRAALTWWLKRGESEPALVTAGALVRYWWFRNDFAAGRSWCERALALAVDVAYAGSQIASLYTACVRASNEGDDDRALAAGEAMLQTARASADPIGIIRAHYALCHAARRQGDQERAVRHALAAIARAREAVGEATLSPIWLAWTLSFLGEAADIVGSERAEAAAEEARVLFCEQGSIWGEANTLQTLATFSLDRGDLARAAHLLAESIVLRRTIGERSGTVESLNGAAGVAARSGRFDGAARLLGAAEAWAGELGYEPHGRQDLDRERTIASARSHLGDARFAAARSDGAGMTWTAALTAARETLGEIAAAEPGILVPLQEFEREPALDAQESLQPHVVLTAFAGQRTDPISPSHLGNGVVHVDRQPSSGLTAASTDLTRREQEILSLLVQRLSDAEIAERLYIGIRTVEFHVGNILGKLGAENRRDATATASRLGLI